MITATRGERGRFGDGGERPAPDVVGRTREAELRAAARERPASFINIGPNTTEVAIFKVRHMPQPPVTTPAYESESQARRVGNIRAQN